MYETAGIICLQTGSTGFSSHKVRDHRVCFVHECREVFLSYHRETKSFKKAKEEETIKSSNQKGSHGTVINASLFLLCNAFVL